eukprot:jgi/Mesen1/8045/ME000043S07429
MKNVGRRVERLAKGLTVSFEGNIGVGKSTFLKLVRCRLQEELQDKLEVEVLPEPLEQWRNVNGTGHNVLQTFYDDPKRYGYLFQNYVFLTRFMQHNAGARRHPRALRLAERCVFTDRCVFAVAAMEQGLFSPQEKAVYEAWYDPILATLPNLVPDAFVYLKADPLVCHQRLKARSEEAGVEMQYLQTLHEKHERWFSRRQDANSRDAPRGTSRGDVYPTQTAPYLTEGVGGTEGILDSDFTHRALHGKPYLVVDCNASFDSEQPSPLRESLVLQVVDYLQKLLAKRT